MRTETPISGLLLDATGWIALADLTTLAELSALNGTSSLFDPLILCPGIHRQQYGTDLNKGELPPCAALTSGYVFRVENQATVFYLQKLGVAGHFVTLSVEELLKTSWAARLKRQIMTFSSLLYKMPIILTLVTLALVVTVEDWWCLAVLLILISARILNSIVICWKGAKEPGVKGDLLVLLSQDHWLRLRGSVDALKLVTAGQWLRDMTFVESSITAIAMLLIYISTAVTSNANQLSKTIIVVLLLLSVGMLELSNERTDVLHMHGCIIRADGKPKAYARRIDLADELIGESGQDDWAIQLRIVNQKLEDGDTVKVIL